MKTLNEVFTDKELERLKKAKGGENWHDFILRLTKLHIDSDSKDGAELRKSREKDLQKRGLE